MGTGRSREGAAGPVLLAEGSTLPHPPRGALSEHLFAVSGEQKLVLLRETETASLPRIGVWRERPYQQLCFSPGSVGL
jgi:hypothetical protein